MSDLDVLKSIVRATRIPAQESEATKALARIRELLADSPAPASGPASEPSERKETSASDRKEKSNRNRSAE